jgi:predicted phosphodiesterase
MRLGLLADIHESIPALNAALNILDSENVEKVVVLGDIAETGDTLAAVTSRLAERRAIGVWGNHDFGLAYEPDDAVRARYSPEIMQFMTSLKPRLELGDCLFTHVLPWLDATDVLQIWHYEDEPATIEQAGKCFDCSDKRFLFVGHFHRWRIITDRECLNWAGQVRIDLSTYNRALISIAALCEGQFAIFDTESCALIPMQIGHNKPWEAFKVANPNGEGDGLIANFRPG